MTDSATRRPTLLGVSVDLMSRLENGQGSVRLDKALAVLDGRLGLTLMVLPKEHQWAREAASSSGSGSSDSPTVPTGAPKP